MPSASRKRPIGVRRMPTYSTPPASLFLMFRSLNDAWMMITGKNSSKTVYSWKNYRENVWWFSDDTLAYWSQVLGLDCNQGRNYFCRVSALLINSARSVKWVPAFGICPECSNIKHGSMSFADQLWSVITPVLGLNMIRDMLDTNSTHRELHMPTSPASHTWLHGLYTRCRACCKKQQKSQWLLELEHTKFSFHVKRNNFQYADLLKKTSLGLTLGFHMQDIKSIVH